MSVQPVAKVGSSAVRDLRASEPRLILRRAAISLNGPVFRQEPTTPGWFCNSVCYNLCMAITGHPTAEFPEFLSLKRFSAADYLQMIDAGVLGKDDRVELIGGMIVDMSPAGIPHNHFLIRILRLFAPLLGTFDMAVQGTFPLEDGNVFDPDFMLLQKSANAYKTKYPEPQDVLLVIEAAESSFRKDQQLKLPVYARAGIPEYWIADLDKEVILVHRQPEGDVYQIVKTFRAEEDISPLAAPDFSITAQQAFN
jgi:Uma2 family endonuclease